MTFGASTCRSQCLPLPVQARPVAAAVAHPPPPAAARRIGVGSLVLLRRGLAQLSAWQDWAHRRRCLRRPDARFLNDSALKDIGLTRDEVGRDSANTFWRP